MHIERVLKALANRRRLTIVKHLAAQKEMGVGEVARSIKLSLKATSKHLSILYHADLIDRRQVGLNVYVYLVQPIPTVLKEVLTNL